MVYSMGIKGGYGPRINVCQKAGASKLQFILKMKRSMGSHISPFMDAFGFDLQSSAEGKTILGVPVGTGDRWLRPAGLRATPFREPAPSLPAKGIASSAGRRQRRLFEGRLPLVLAAPTLRSGWQGLRPPSPLATHSPAARCCAKSRVDCATPAEGNGEGSVASLPDAWSAGRALPLVVRPLPGLVPPPYMSMAQRRSLRLGWPEGSDALDSNKGENSKLLIRLRLYL